MPPDPSTRALSPSSCFCWAARSRRRTRPTRSSSGCGRALAATALALPAGCRWAPCRLRVVVVHAARAHRTAALWVLRRSRAVRYAEPLHRLQALARRAGSRPAQRASTPSAPTRPGRDARRGVVVAVVDRAPRAGSAAGCSRAGTCSPAATTRPTTTGTAPTWRAPLRRSRQRPGRVGVAPSSSPGQGPRSDRCGQRRDVAAGIVWAADHGARIVNLSLGGSEASTVLADLTYARIRGGRSSPLRATMAGCRCARRPAGVIAVGAVVHSRARALQRRWPGARSGRARRRHPAADARRRRRLRGPLLVERRAGQEARHAGSGLRATGREGQRGDARDLRRRHRRAHQERRRRRRRRRVSAGRRRR